MVYWIVQARNKIREGENVGGTSDTANTLKRIPGASGEDLVHLKDRTRQEAWYVYSVYPSYRLILDIIYHPLSCLWFLGPQHNSQLRALHLASSRWKEASTCSCHMGLALWSKMITLWIQQKYGSSFGKQKVKVILRNHIQTAEDYAGDNFESTWGHDTFSAHRCSTYYLHVIFSIHVHCAYAESERTSIGMVSLASIYPSLELDIE